MTDRSVDFTTPGFVPPDQEVSEAASQGKVKESRWAKPSEVSDLQFAFPAHVVGVLLPEKDEIPKAFLRGDPSVSEWIEFQRRWFMDGLTKESGFVGVSLKDGIDGERAFRHLGAVQKSYEPSYEHKEAGVAWLASLWFHKVLWEGDDG